MEHFDPVIVQPYPFGPIGVVMWDVMRVRGRTRVAVRCSGGICRA